MALTSERFAEELRGLVAERRAFWDHPFIRKFRQGELLWRFFDGLATTPVEQITGKAA